MNVENIKNDANKTVEIQKAKHIFFEFNTYNLWQPKYSI